VAESLQVERLDNGVLSFRGPLTMENVPPFLNAVRREGAYTSCSKAGRRVALTGVNQRVRKVFEITKVEQIFLMFPTLADAIEAFTNAGSA
jgi:STAS domain